MGEIRIRRGAEKPACLQAVWRQHGRAWEERGAQYLHRFGIRERIAAARGKHRIEHHGSVRVFGEDRGDDLRIARRTEHTELERRDRNILEHAARLTLDPRRFDREQAFDALRVLHRECGQHRQRMAAETRDGQEVRLYPRTAGWIEAANARTIGGVDGMR